MAADDARETRIQATARQILAATREDKPSRLSRERLQGDMMDWAMADERLKVEMLRFVDVFPTLRSRPEIARHLREYFTREGIATPKALRWGIGLTGRHSPVAPLASAVIRQQMKGFAQRFIVGRDARDAVPALKALRDAGTGFTLDVLGEATVSEAEGEAYRQRLPRPAGRPGRPGCGGGRPSPSSMTRRGGPSRASTSASRSPRCTRSSTRSTSTGASPRSRTVCAPSSAKASRPGPPSPSTSSSSAFAT